MTKEEIRKRYTECTEPYIFTAEENASDNIRFDQLLEILCSETLYMFMITRNIFDFCSDGEEVKEDQFDDVCHLWSRLIDSWNRPESYFSLVYVTLKDDRENYSNEIFIMEGKSNRLNHIDIKRFSMPYSAEYFPQTVVSYLAIPFFQKDFDLIYHLLEDCNKLRKSEDSVITTQEDDEKQDRIEKSINNRIKNHMLNNEKCFKHNEPFKEKKI